MNFFDNYPQLECCLDKTGSDCCEVFFSLNGSWVKNHHAYTILDMIRNHFAMTRLAEIRANNKRLVFRKARSKQDNLDKQYQHVGKNQNCNLKDYPNRNQAISAWNRGIAKAREMAQRVGIGSGIDLMANNEDDDDGDDDNNDDDKHSDNSGSNIEESNSSDEDKAEKSDSDEDDSGLKSHLRIQL